MPLLPVPFKSMITLEDLTTAISQFKQTVSTLEISESPEQTSGYLTVFDAQIICRPLANIVDQCKTDELLCSALEQFLISRWSYIQGGILSYTHNHDSEATKLCYLIAKYLHQQDPRKKIIQYLMPPITRIVDTAGIFDVEDIDDMPLSQMILDEDGVGLIPTAIFELMTLSSHMRDLFHPFTEPGVKPRKITPIEIQTLLNWSGDCGRRLAELQAQYLEVQSQGETLGLGLRHLINWLKKGSRVGGHGGSDLVAGVDAFVGIGLFQRLFQTLTPKEQESVRAINSGNGTHTLGYYLDLLLRKETLTQNDSAENSWHCIDTIATDLERVLEQNPELFQQHMTALTTYAESFADLKNEILALAGRDEAQDTFFTKFITTYGQKTEVLKQHLSWLYPAPGAKAPEVIRDTPDWLAFIILYDNEALRLPLTFDPTQPILGGSKSVITYALEQHQFSKFSVLITHCHSQAIPVNLTANFVNAINYKNQRQIDFLWKNYRDQLMLTHNHASLLVKLAEAGLWTLTAEAIAHFCPANQPIPEEAQLTQVSLFALQQGNIDFVLTRVHRAIDCTATLLHPPFIGYNLLHFAIDINDPALWEYVKPHMTSETILNKNEHVPSPLHFAIQRNRQSIAIELLSYCIQTPDDINWHELLHFCLINCKVSMFKQLLIHHDLIDKKALQTVLNDAVTTESWWAISHLLQHESLNYDKAVFSAIEHQQFDLARNMPCSANIMTLRSKQPQTDDYDIVALAYHYRQLDLLQKFIGLGGSLNRIPENQPQYMSTAVRIILDGNPDFITLVTPDIHSESNRQKLEMALLEEAIKVPRNTDAVLRLIALGVNLAYQKKGKPFISWIDKESPTDWLFIEALLKAVHPYQAQRQDDLANFGSLLLELAKNKSYNLIPLCIHPNISMDWSYTNSGYGAIHYLIQYDAIESLKLLLAHKNTDPVKPLRAEKPSAMDYAIEIDALTAIEAMMRYWQDNPDSTNQQRAMTALFMALKAKKHAVIKLMCPYIQQWSIKVDGQYVLTYALKQSDEQAYSLIEACIQDLPGCGDILSDALFWCLENDKKPLALEIISKGFNIEYTKDKKTVTDIILNKDPIDWELLEAILQSQQPLKHTWQNDNSKFGRILLNAVEQQKFDLISLILHPNISMAWRYNKTGYGAFHFAIQHRAIAVVDQLLATNASPFEALATDKPSPFEYAISEKACDIVIAILSHLSSKPDNFDELLTAIKQLIDKSYLDPIQQFIEKNRPSLLLYKKNKSLLEALISLHHPQITMWVCEQPEIKAEPDILHTTRLNLALNERAVSDIDSGMQNGELVFSRTLNPLKTAVLNQQWWCVERIIAYLNNHPKQRPIAMLGFAIVHAMKEQQFNLAEKMIFNGVNLDIAITSNVDEHGFTALHYAIKYNQLPLLALFLKHGAKGDKYYDGQKNALEYARDMGETEAEAMINNFLASDNSLNTSSCIWHHPQAPDETNISKPDSASLQPQ